MSRSFFLALCCSVLSQHAASQERYHAPDDSVFIQLVNPYKMYWIRNGDTLGQPVHAVTVEAQAWREQQGVLQVAIRRLDLDVHRTVTVDTFTIVPSGVVRNINGHPPGLNERVDLLLRLPGRRLVPGLTWSDTLNSEQGGPSGRDFYIVARTYRVQRLFDSSGSRLAEITAMGDVRYKHSWWTDSVAGKYLIFDVTGPDTERFVFAVKHGQLLHRSWSMNLTGTGTVPDSAGGVDTLPAGLISRETQLLISRERAHLLTRSLPGLDTSLTLSSTGGTILLHTVRRAGDDLEAGMARNDGLLGTARVGYSRGVAQSYHATWTDTAATARQIEIRAAGDALHIRDEAVGDTATAIPTTWWGIADYAMNELLVPVFLAHPPDGITTRFAIYRPYPRHWDVGVASVRRLGESLVASYRLGDDSLPTNLLITHDGDLLFGENSGPTSAQRVPTEGSTRRATLEAILKTLRN